MESLLDNAALSRLRDAVRELRRHDCGAIPHSDVVALATSVGGGANVTLDLGASEVVGVPLLVVGAAPSVSNGLPELTPRELEVARLVAEGLTNKGIALRLGISPATVKDHVHHILVKTELPSRAAIVAHLSR